MARRLQAFDQAAALCFALVNNHPFVGGDKRLGQAATETFLILNGSEIDAPVDEQERLMLDLASGRLTRDQPETSRLSQSGFFFSLLSTPTARARPPGAVGVRRYAGSL